MELGTENQARKENAVTSTRQTLRIFRELGFQSVQQYQSSHKSTSINVGIANQFGEKCHERGKGAVLTRNWLQSVSTGENLEGGNNQLVDHILRHRSVDEYGKCLEIECAHDVLDSWSTDPRMAMLLIFVHPCRMWIN